jgi:signal transduction histidine kinase
VKWLSNIPLTKKISLLTGLGLVGGIIVFSLLGIRAVNRTIEVMLQERLNTAYLVANHADEVLKLALGELENTAKVVEIDGAIADIEPHIEALEQMYKRLAVYTQGIFLVDMEGQILWSNTGNPSLAKGVLLHPDIRQIMTAERPNISGLIQIPGTETPVVLLVGSTGEELQGSKILLVVAIDLAESTIHGFIQPIRVGNTGYVEIVDQKGIVLARTEPSQKLTPFEKSDHSGRFTELIAAGEPGLRVCHSCHEPEQKVIARDVMAFVPLSSAHWGVVIRQSEEEALAPARELRQSLLFFGVVLIAIAFLFVIVTTQNVVKRISNLAKASQRIAGGDLASPVTRLGKDEIGLLAQNLDHMRARLMMSQEELTELYKDAQRKEEIRGELLHSLLTVQEEERRRIARELHDETSQTLASLTANLEAAMTLLPTDISKAKAIIRKIQHQSVNIIEEIHRLIYELRPEVLDDLGLVTAIQWLAENTLQKAGITVNFKTRGRGKRLESQLEITLFRVIQEAVHNIVRHADAKSADISLHFMKNLIKVSVTDDGRGFDVAEAMTAKDRPRGLGLLGMKERVQLMKGNLEIRSRHGGGTEIDIEIPLGKEIQKR